MSKEFFEENNAENYFKPLYGVIIVILYEFNK
jgi:hypothetical protein